LCYKIGTNLQNLKTEVETKKEKAVHFNFGNIRERIRDYSNILIAMSLALSGFMPIILEADADAAQLANRKVTISTSQASATGVSYTFDFTPVDPAVVQSIKLEFCTLPLGACTKPAGMDINYTTTSLSATQTFSEATAFAEYTGADAGQCDDHNNATAANSTEYCVTRTDTDAETDDVNKQITIDGAVNPSIDAPTTNSTSFYVRVSLYSDTGFSTMVHEGTVAAAIVNQLTVTGRVQERLVFCVFAQHDDDSLPTDCTDTEALESVSVDIGVVDNLSIARSPVNDAPPASLGNDRYGAAMVNTNASNGVTIAYYGTAAGSGTNELRAFRVPGATCDASSTSTVDQCFISADDSTGETFTAGTERFGMQISCINTTQGTTNNIGKTGGVFTYGSGTGGTINSAYNSGVASASNMADVGDDCENDTALTTQKFAWRDTGTAQAIISSSSVVDDEIVKMRFGATANATTPTGTYTVASTYIATPTF
jgi:hypothetical protein